MRRLFGCMFLLAAVMGPPARAADVAPHTSYDQLVTANGYGAFVFRDDRLADGFPHLYQALDVDTSTPDLLYDSYFGWTDGAGNGEWLTDIGDARYEKGTGILVVTRASGDVRVTEVVFAPMALGGAGVAQVLHVENTGTDTVPARQVVLLSNWHVGGEERVTSVNAERWREAGGDGTVDAWGPAATDVSCGGVYDAVRAGVRIGGGCDTRGNDVVPALGWSVPALGPGEDAWVGALTRIDGEPADDWGAGTTPAAWLDVERGLWTLAHADSTPPAGLSDAESELYRHSLAFLLMAQVQESGTPSGQIPASLPLAASVGDFHHIWNITWVRDGAYAAAALARAGFADRAVAALAFMVQPGATGDWEAYVGGPHALSVCRVYGDGSEWTDLDENGPNIEFDGFGLWLWALGEARDSGAALPEALVDTALDGVADVLVRLVDPTTGLLQADSSIWERHWNGHQEQFTYTNAWAVAGLRVAAELADERDDRDRATVYRDTSERITAAMGDELVDGSGILAASREQRLVGGDHLDLAAVEAFNVGALDPRGDVFDATLAAWDDGLRVASGHGYMRNDDGSVYDSHEWLVMDLRFAEALRRSCRADRAAALEDWVLETARANDNIVPELLQPERGDFAGPAPMLGFGAGAWMLALHRRDLADAACAQAEALEDTAPTALGCACGTTSGAPDPRGAVAFAFLGGVVARRRRSHSPLRDGRSS